MKAQIHPTIVLERRVRGLSERKLSNFVTLACRTVRLRGAMTLLITNNRRMRMLNARFRGKDRATDVLSFPGPAFANGVVGDIAISLDIAARNARALRHSVADEIRILVLHGLLHLSGYDHEADNGEMERRERALRKQLGLPSGLIERSGDTDRHGARVSQAE